MGPSSLITTLCYLRDTISWRKIITGTKGRRKETGKDRGKEDMNTQRKGKIKERIKIGRNEEKQGDTVIDLPCAGGLVNLTKPPVKLGINSVLSYINF